MSLGARDDVDSAHAAHIINLVWGDRKEIEFDDLFRLAEEERFNGLTKVQRLEKPWSCYPLGWRKLDTHGRSVIKGRACFIHKQINTYLARV